MNSCSQYQNKNSTQKKVLKTNLAVVQIAEELANNNEMIVVDTTEEKTVLCLVQYVHHVVKILQYLLSLVETDLYIAETASKLKEQVVTDKLGNLKAVELVNSLFLWSCTFMNLVKCPVKGTFLVGIL